MEVTVIDTLRYADQLKSAGVKPEQAEAMSRALNDELTGGVATKDDLRSAVDDLKGDIAREVAKVGARVDAMDEKFEAKFGAMDEKFEAKFDAMDEKFEAKFDAMDEKFEAKFDAMDEKFEAKFGTMDEKFEAKFGTMDEKLEAEFGTMDEKFGALRDRVDTQGRYVFMVLALIAALGLYNAIAPHVPGKAPAKPEITTAQARDA